MSQDSHTIEAARSRIEEKERHPYLNHTASAVCPICADITKRLNQQRTSND